MNIDPARLARIRSRLLAAAALTAVGSAACSGPEHVNTRAPDPVDTAHPINERAPDAPSASPSAEPAADAPSAVPAHVNTPRPDTSTTALDAPPDKPTVQTINRPPQPFATASASPTAKSPPPGPKDVGKHINVRKPDD